MSFWGNFGDALGWFLWTFVLIAYLMAVFSIIGDLFRDHKLSGWAKAVWILFLFIVPFLTALIYLIARGRGMAERQNKEVKQAQTAADDYIRTVAGSSPSDEIAKAKSLLDAGTITAAEYETIKAHALSGTAK